jgi:hypothetical protein
MGAFGAGTLAHEPVAYSPRGSEISAPHVVCPEVGQLWALHEAEPVPPDAEVKGLSPDGGTLLSAQADHGIDARSLTGGHVARQQCGKAEQRGDDCEGQRIS